jgi:hypothetical protein
VQVDAVRGLCLDVYGPDALVDITGANCHLKVRSVLQETSTLLRGLQASEQATVGAVDAICGAVHAMHATPVAVRQPVSAEQVQEIRIPVAEALERLAGALEAAWRERDVMLTELRSLRVRDSFIGLYTAVIDCIRPYLFDPIYSHREI